MSLSDQNQQPRVGGVIGLEYNTAVIAIAHGIVSAVHELKQTEPDYAPRLHDMLSGAIAKGIHEGVAMLKKDELDVASAVKGGVIAAVFSVGAVAIALLVVWQVLHWIGSSFALH